MRVRQLEPPFKVSGEAFRYDTGDEDNFSQARVFWENVLDDGAQRRLVANIAESLKNAAPFIQKRAIVNFSQVNSELGRQLMKALKDDHMFFGRRV